MTRQEEIRNAIDKIIPISPSRNGRTYEQSLIATGFESGVKWADSNQKSPWINVEVDLPHKHDSLLIKCLPYNSKLTKPVLTLVDDDSYQVCDMFINEEGKWEWSYNGTVLYWMSIPKLEEE